MDVQLKTNKSLRVKVLSIGKNKFTGKVKSAVSGWKVGEVSSDFEISSFEMVVDFRKAIEVSDMVSEFRLVGIIPGDEPQAIIEDKKSGQTLFLKKGERLAEVVIKEISEGRVVLGYNEETITLSL